MTRELTTHKVNGLNDLLRIEVIDQPGSGNACHVYSIASEEPRIGDKPPAVMTLIRFQAGPMQVDGLNGISNEVLLAILIDRLQGFQSGDFKCRENAIALTHLEEAMMWLCKRTRDRMARGVEGTMNK